MRKVLRLLLLCVLVLSLFSNVAIAAPPTSFTDDFSGSGLDSAWTVWQHVGRYSLTDNPGYLRMKHDARAYDWSWHNDWASGGGWSPALTLMRPFDGDRWVLRTKATFNLQWPGSGGQGSYFAVALGDGTDTYLEIERTKDDWYGSNLLRAVLVVGNQEVAARGDFRSPSDVVKDGWLRYTYWLEVERKGQEVILRYSYDGTSYQEALRGLLAPTTPARQRAVISGGAFANAGSYTDWDFVRVAPTETPGEVDLQRGLVGYWPFNGNAIDESGNGRNGVVANGANLTSDRFGNANRAYWFNGYSSYIRIDGTIKLQSYSISAWIKNEKQAIIGRIFSDAGWGNTLGSVDFALDNVNRQLIAINQTGGYGQGQVRSTTDHQISNNWTHVVATFDSVSGVPRLYIDGSEIPTYFWPDGLQYMPTPNQNSIYSFYIGAMGNLIYDFFGGNIDDVRVYDRPLNGNEVSALYVENPVPPDTLPATTGYTLTPPPLASGWNNTHTTLNLNATDNEGGSGVKKITHSASGAQNIPSTTTSGATASLNLTSEGTTTVSFYAEDNAGNVEAPKTVVVKIDKSSPTIIQGSITGSSGIEGWFRSDVTVNFTASDSLSGLQSSTDASFALTASGEGSAVSTPSKDVFDNAGNKSTAGPLSFKVDKTLPSIGGIPDRPANADGWYRDNVTINWIVGDALSGLDPSTIPAAALVSAEGSGQGATASVKDKAGNAASDAVSGINIDKTSPTITYSGNAQSYTVDQTVNIVPTVADNLSGVASSTAASIVGPAYTFALGDNTFNSTATDKAGNVGAGSAKFKVSATYDSLANLTRLWVAQQGIAKSLVSKLEAAKAAEARGNANARGGQIGAYINEVKAQAGKAIPADKAEILIGLARAL